MICRLMVVGSTTNAVETTHVAKATGRRMELNDFPKDESFSFTTP
jgi:hypothetical protein